MRTWIIGLLVLLVAAGCTNIGLPEQMDENFRLYVSDAPADISDFESLQITFSGARIFAEGDKWEEIEFDQTVELTELIGSEVEELALTYLEPGNYTKIELNVKSISGIVDGEEAEVMVPSKKLQITKPFVIVEGNMTEFVFDIEVVKKGQDLSYNLLPNIVKSGLKEEHDEAEREEDEDESEEASEEEEEEMEEETEESEGDEAKDEEEEESDDSQNDSSSNDSNPQEGEGSLDLHVSDAPAAIEDFDRLSVHIYQARVFPEGKAWIIYNISETVDLTKLVGDASESILKTELASGNYTKVELHVDNVEGVINATNMTVKLPSDKLQITVPFKVEVGKETTFVFDIEVVRKGNGGYNLLPNIAESGEVDEEDLEEVETEGCQTDDDCLTSESCVEMTCVEQEEEEEETPQCTIETVEEDCEGIALCVEGECETVECKADTDCIEGSLCVENECVEQEEETPQCTVETVEEDCEGIALCVEGMCETVDCITSEDCEEGDSCTENLCVETLDEGNQTNSTA